MADPRDVEAVTSANIETLRLAAVVDASQWRWPNDPANADWTHRRPEIVTLCGSTRFVDAFNLWRQKLTLDGVIVLSIEIVATQQYDEDPQHTNRANKEMLDLLHLEKIKLSDRIVVLNVGGYIGESTSREIEYAKHRGIRIDYAY